MFLGRALTLLLPAYWAFDAAIATSVPSETGYVFATSGTITLRSDGNEPAIVTLDYSESFEGHPTFEVISASGDTSGLEFTFAESKSVLDNNYMVSELCES